MLYTRNNFDIPFIIENYRLLSEWHIKAMQSPSLFAYRIVIEIHEVNQGGKDEYLLHLYDMVPEWYAHFSIGIDEDTATEIVPVVMSNVTRICRVFRRVVSRRFGNIGRISAGCEEG